MEHQLKCIILACLALTFFSCESLPPADKVREQQQSSLVMIHKGGYLPFTIDATSHLKNNSENTIEVEVMKLEATADGLAATSLSIK
jgi:hypothetical protein